MFLVPAREYEALRRDLTTVLRQDQAILEQWPQTLNTYPRRGRSKDRDFRLPSLGVAALLGRGEGYKSPALKSWLDQLLDALPWPLVERGPDSDYAKREQICLALMLRYGLSKTSGWHTALAEHMPRQHNPDGILYRYLSVARDAELEILLHLGGPDSLQTVVRSCMDLRQRKIIALLAVRVPEMLLCYGPHNFKGLDLDRFYIRAANGLLHEQCREVARTLAHMEEWHSPEVVAALRARFMDKR